MKWSRVLEDIEAARPAGGDWCTDDKAGTLAAIVIALRPKVVVEIGVWMGGSLVPMAMALQALPGETPRKIIGIDPWSADASVAGQTGANEAWWRSVDHEAAYETTRKRLHDLGIPFVVIDHAPFDNPAICELWRMKSDQVALHGFRRTPVDLLHIDGNHADAAYYDVVKFSPYVTEGGFLFMDDIGWEGGHVGRACQMLLDTGFVQLYTLDTGALFQRVGLP